MEKEGGGGGEWRVRINRVSRPLRIRGLDYRAICVRLFGARSFSDDILSAFLIGCSFLISGVWYFSNSLFSPFMCECDVLGECMCVCVRSILNRNSSMFV